MRNRLIAYSLGALCHSLFAAAIVTMAYMLFEGLSVGIFPLGSYGRLFNILLLIQFPILHSFFLSPRGRRLLQAPFPPEIAKDLVTTSFSVISSLQLLAVFLLWTPAYGTWFVPTGQLLVVWTGVYIVSWLFLVVALHEAGMALHSGALGWRAVARGQKPHYPPHATKGLHSQCRHPIYLAFSAIILTAPLWRFDHCILSIVWVSYCFVGPVLKERRLATFFKKEYEMYKKQVPYMVPRILYGLIGAPFGHRERYKPEEHAR